MNKKLVSLLIAGTLTSTAWAMAPNTDLNLMPYPQTVELKQGNIVIDKDFSIFIKGYNSERVDATAKRFITRLERQTGLPTLNWQAESASDATLVIDIDDAPKARFRISTLMSLTP